MSGNGKAKTAHQSDDQSRECDVAVAPLHDLVQCCFAVGILRVDISTCRHERLEKHDLVGSGAFVPTGSIVVVVCMCVCACACVRVSVCACGVERAAKRWASIRG